MGIRKNIRHIAEGQKLQVTIKVTDRLIPELTQYRFILTSLPFYTYHAVFLLWQ